MTTEDFQNLKTEFAVLSTKVNEWMATTTEYRKHLCEKVDDIKDVLGNLPCKERKNWYQSMNKQVNFMWGIFILIIAALIAEWIKK